MHPYRTECDGHVYEMRLVPTSTGWVLKGFTDDEPDGREVPYVLELNPEPEADAPALAF